MGSNSAVRIYTFASGGGEHTVTWTLQDSGDGKNMRWMRNYMEMQEMQRSKN